MKNEFEIRMSEPVEVREDESEVKVSGYAAVFEQEAEIAGGAFIEKIARGAFDKTLSNKDDVVFLINHEGLPLARTRSGTLSLSVDKHGLKMETILDATDPDVQSIVPKMKRGDLDKMSFAFNVQKQEWDDESEPPKRTIIQAVLRDVAIVTTPAYDGTDIGLRSGIKALEDHQAEKKKHNFKAAQKRLAMKADLDVRERDKSKAKASR